MRMRANPPPRCTERNRSEAGESGCQKCIESQTDRLQECMKFHWKSMQIDQNGAQEAPKATLGASRFQVP